MSIYRDINAIGTTGSVIKSTGGKIQGWFIANRHATLERFIKFYDKATAPTSADTPVMTIPLLAGEKANCNFEGVAGSGWEFANGIGIRAVTTIADNGNTDPSTNDVVVNIRYV